MNPTNLGSQQNAPCRLQKNHLVNLVTLTKAFQAHAFGSFFQNGLRENDPFGFKAIRSGSTFHERSKRKRIHVDALGCLFENTHAALAKCTFPKQVRSVSFLQNGLSENDAFGL